MKLETEALAYFWVGLIIGLGFGYALGVVQITACGLWRALS